MDIIKTIKNRKSVRSYDGRPLTPDTVARLTDAIGEATDPFGGSVTIRLIRFDLKDGYRPGTYGFIKGATDFFIIGYADDEASALSAGFRFEQVVLRACAMGLGTCWIGGTFKGSDFDRGQTWPAEQSLKIISPVGIPAHSRLIERIGRRVMGSDSRKPFGELFFDGDFTRPLAPDSRFGTPLEMLRLAPSSTNSQPWRALVAGDTVHFYCKPKSKLSVLDCGIGLCHFSLAEQELSRHGRFLTAADAPAPPHPWRYLRSFKETDA